MKNMEELLSLITKGMSEKDIELTHVDLYEQAVGINNKVKVCLGNRGNDRWFLVHRTDRTDARDRLRVYSNKDMVDRVLELLTGDDWLPGDDIEAYGEWFTLVVEESSYYTPGTSEKHIDIYYRLLDENYNISDRMTLNYLKSNYSNVNLEKRLK